MTWVVVDLSTLCVLFLILTLSALWAYVAIFRERTRLPSVFHHEVSQKPNNGSSGSKKASKSKGKRKQVDGSPRPSKQAGKKDIQKVPSVSVVKAGGNVKKPDPLPTSRSEGSELKTSGSSKQVHHKKKEGKAEGRSKEEQVGEAKLKSNVTRKEESEEGEWKTQLSRPQLRALKQKRSSSRGSGSQETVAQASTLPSEQSRFKAADVERSDSFRKGVAGPAQTPPEEVKAKKSTPTPHKEEEEEEPKAISSQKVAGGPTNEDSEKLGSSLSPETSEVPSFPVSDVETALVEAAKSSLEEGAALTDTATQKARRKNKQVDLPTESMAVGVTGEDSDEWVVIN